MSIKNDNFHRLAGKRIVPIIEGLRIFSNLHSQNYEWTREEVMSYIDQIDEARNLAVDLFQQQKQWGSPDVHSDTEESISDTSSEPVCEHKESKKLSLYEQIKEAAKPLSHDDLVEMIYMLNLNLDHLLCQSPSTTTPSIS